MSYFLPTPFSCRLLPSPRHTQDTIEHYKKNLLEREEALAEKEKTILDLRGSTRSC